VGVIDPTTSVELTALFRRNGCVRRHDAARYARQGSMKYKKGEEIRLVANREAERVQIQRLLKRAGFKAGRPFRKSKHGTQVCIPIYGREQVAGFVKMVEETEKCQPSAAAYVATAPPQRADGGNEKNRKDCREESGTQEIRKPEGSAVTESFQK